MPQAVQDACQWLLRQDSGPMPAADAGSCVSAAVAAGGGGTQQLDSRTSLLPSGSYTSEFLTGDRFRLRLASDDGDLRITVDGDRRELTVDGRTVSADAGGTAEQAYAAILVGAAESTTNPRQLELMLAAAQSIAVEYAPEGDDGPAVRLSARLPADSAAAPARNADLWLDEFYRPVRLEFNGAGQGVAFALTATNSGWQLP